MKPLLRVQRHSPVPDEPKLRLLPRSRQVDALCGEFGRALDKPADLPFALFGRKRWIEQLLDLHGGKICKLRGIARRRRTDLVACRRA